MEIDPEVAKLRFALKVLPPLLGKLGVNSTLASGITAALGDPQVITDDGEVDLTKFDHVLREFMSSNQKTDPPAVITCSRCGKIALLHL